MMRFTKNPFLLWSFHCYIWLVKFPDWVLAFSPQLLRLYTEHCDRPGYSASSHNEISFNCEKLRLATGAHHDWDSHTDFLCCDSIALSELSYFANLAQLVTLKRSGGSPSWFYIHWFRDGYLRPWEPSADLDLSMIKARGSTLGNHSRVIVQQYTGPFLDFSM